MAIVATRFAAALKPFARPAITTLAARRLTSHSHGPGIVSSKSLASKTRRRSGDAKRPKLESERRRWPAPMISCPSALRRDRRPLPPECRGSRRRAIPPSVRGAAVSDREACQPPVAPGSRSGRDLVVGSKSAWLLLGTRLRASRPSSVARRRLHPRPRSPHVRRLRLDGPSVVERG